MGKVIPFKKPEPRVEPKDDAIGESIPEMSAEDFRNLFTNEEVNEIKAELDFMDEAGNLGLPETNIEEES